MTINKMINEEIVEPTLSEASDGYCPTCKYALYYERCVGAGCEGVTLRCACANFDIVCDICCLEDKEESYDYELVEIVEEGDKQNEFNTERLEYAK